MNAPERFELFTLQENEKKVSYQKDTKIKDAASFIVRKEDHTLGNVIRMQLLRDKDVLFAGYRMPHPLEHNIVIKIQTTPNSNPMKALEDSINDLTAECCVLEEKFKNELQRKRNPNQHENYL